MGPKLSAGLSRRVVVPMEGRAAFPKPSGRVSHPVSSKPISQGPVLQTMGAGPRLLPFESEVCEEAGTAWRGRQRQPLRVSGSAVARSSVQHLW